MKMFSCALFLILIMAACFIPHAHAGSRSGAIGQPEFGWLPLRPIAKSPSPVFVFTPRIPAFEPDLTLSLKNSDDRRDQRPGGGRPSPMAIAEKIRFLRPIFELREKFDQIPRKISGGLPHGFIIPMLMKDSDDGQKSGMKREQGAGEPMIPPTKDRQTGETPHDQYYLGYQVTNPDDEKRGYWFIAVGFRTSGTGGGSGRPGRGDKQTTSEREPENTTNSFVTKKEFQGPIVGLVGKF